MSPSELIGFLASFGLFIFLMIQGALKERNRKLYPEREEERLKAEEEEFRAYLNKLELKEEELPEELRPATLKPAKKPPPQPAIKRALPPIAAAPVVASSYEVEQRSRTSRVERLIKENKDPGSMVLYYEIFGPPKALRDPPH